MVEALSALDGSGITVSVDTIHPEVLEACLRYDIHAVNDISGLSNPRFGELARDSGLPAILMASRSIPGDAVGFPATLETLRLVVERCGEYGIREFILDPGIGRWVPERTSRDDWDLVRRFGEFLILGRPLLAAVSRKTFIGELLGRGRMSGSPDPWRSLFSLPWKVHRWCGAMMYGRRGMSSRSLRRCWVNEDLFLGVRGKDPRHPRG